MAVESFDILLRARHTKLNLSVHHHYHYHGHAWVEAMLRAESRRVTRLRVFGPLAAGTCTSCTSSCCQLAVQQDHQ